MKNNNVYPKDFFSLKIKTERKQCFFAMPFSPEYDPVFSRLKSDLKKSGYSLVRVDEIPTSTAIMNKIMLSLCSSQYVIVDISSLNPNVFYELGIAHCLKESRNVIIIKDNSTKVPGDIGHITYIEYEKDNLMLLKVKVLEYLDKISFYSELENALHLNRICSTQSETESVVKLLENLFSDEELIILTNLLNENEPINSEHGIIRTILGRIMLSIKQREPMMQNCELDPLVKVFVSALHSISKHFSIPEDIRTIIYSASIFDSEEKNLVLRTLISIDLASSGMYVDIVIPWIINYLARSKSCHVDLNRYKIESFLLSSENEIVNDYIINSVLDSDRHIREHIADIVGDKRLTRASNNLRIQLSREKNIYSAASIIEAIGKVGSVEDIQNINNWISDHFSSINNPGGNFVFKHALNAILRLDTSSDKSDAEAFKNDYLEYMSNGSMDF